MFFISSISFISWSPMVANVPYFVSNFDRDLIKNFLSFPFNLYELSIRSPVNIIKSGFILFISFIKELISFSVITFL